MDLDKVEALLGPYKCAPHYFSDPELSYVNYILKVVPEMIQELRTSREVIDVLNKSSLYYGDAPRFLTR